MIHAVQSLWMRLAARARREEGQAMTEYGLIIALVAVVAIVGLTPVGTTLKAMFENIATKLGWTGP